ncbi:MAG: SidE phosphodiesterase domain-containing protein [Candidatus Berkiella sp.]
MVKKESEKESSEAAKKKEALKTLTTSLKDARKEASMLVKKEKKQIADIKEHTGFKQGKQKKFEKRLREEGTFTEAKPLLQGPLPKNKYTYQVEGLIKAFLNKEKVDIRWGDNNQIIVKIGDKPEFNLTEAMKYANFNHIELTSDDYKKYVAFLQDKGPKGSRVKPENRAGGFPDEKFFEEQEKKQKKKSKGGISSALDYAEKCAINIYTKQDNLKDGKAYYALMNEFLRGNTDYLRANYTSSRALTDQCTELLAHLAMCISGTNKLPDEPLPETAWREVPEMPDFVTQENVAAAQSGSITTVMQMTSTNRDKPKDFGLAAGGNYIMYRNLKGVDVSPYSKFQGGAEREILMPPTQIVVTHHAKYAVGQGDAHFFIAQPVTTYENMAQQALQMPPQSELPADVPPLPPLRSKTAPAPVMPQPTVVQPKVKSQKIKQERAASVSAMGGIYDLSPLADALLHANKEHLSQPYTEKDVYRHDFELNTAKGRVVRPNHNIVHTIRKTSFLPHIVSYLQAYGKKNPNPYRDITEQEMRKLQAVLIFSVTGRKSDASHGDNAKKYEEYKQLSAQNFRDYFMPDGKGLFAPEEIEAYASMVQFLGSPKPSKPAPAGSYAHLYQVLNLAHNMDLQRCKNPSEYNKVFVKPMSTLVGESHAKELKTHAAQALAATGNKKVGGHY